MNKKVNGIFVVGAAAAMFFTACGLAKKLDVVGKDSIPSFEAMLKAVEGKVKADESSSGWWLVSPDSQAAFFWSWDYSKSGMYDVMLDIDAQPFLDAGLDLDKLPQEYLFYKGGPMGGSEIAEKVIIEHVRKHMGFEFERGGSRIAEKLIIVGAKLGSDELKYDGAPTPLAAYERLVDRYPGRIGYHIALDHYGVDLGGGNMFEWARDLDKNDKDIVFVLDPQPLITAGVKPEAVAGWVFAKVPVMSGGKNVEVDKFLKPFDL